MDSEEAVIERNSTASSMAWSIELEKALRSKKPDGCVEAILQIGKKLEQWSGEPEATMAVYNIFGLVPGEDRLFANTIFLRLAVAFQLGSKHTRVSIVRVFLSLHRHCKGKKKSKHVKGILSKSRIQNHLELLKRVKIVFDMGDPESRALALVLFGCCADFAKDSAQIRYLVLSTLVSSNDLEVRASLFAAGCFSELTDDFASVVLEMLVNIVTSSETVSAVRLAAARIFSKMGCSNTIANKAYKAAVHDVVMVGQMKRLHSEYYKHLEEHHSRIIFMEIILSLMTGLKLVLDSTEEDFLVAMLVSLSKLAYRSTFIISEQVEFLSSLLNNENALRLRATALRCLLFIFAKGMCQSLISASLIKAICSMVDEPELPSTMQCEVLKLLHKIILCTSTNLACADIPEFAELLSVIDNASRSPIMSKSVAAIHVLVNIVIKFKRTEMGSDDGCNLPLPSQVVSLIMDQIALLVKPLLDLCQFNPIEVFGQVQSLLTLLLRLVEEHADLGVLLLDKVYLFIEHLANNVAGRQADLAVNDTVLFRGEWDKGFGSKLLYMLNSFVLSCLQNLNEAGTVTNEVFDKVKILVQCVHDCSFFDCYTHSIYALLLDSQIIWICMINRNEEAGGVDGNSQTSLQNYLNEHELFTLEFAKRMLSRRNTWPAYKAGIYAACQGAWITASFIFGQLIMKVQSDTCSCWLKLLSQLAHSERIVQLLLFPKHGSNSVDLLEIKEFGITLSVDDLSEIGEDATRIINEPNCSKALVAYQILISAGRTLETTFTSANAFCFQRWFLALRAKVLKSVIDVFRVLSTFPSGQNDISNDAQVGGSIMVESHKFLQQITRVSFQLKRLSQEFDLITTSFIGMDSKSSNTVKALALCCSLLAVSAGFALYIPSLSACKNLIHDLDSSQNCAHSMLIQNLAGRLWNLDSEMSTNLCTLLEVTGKSKNCFHLWPKNQVLDNTCEVKDIVNVCKYAVSGISCLQNEANGAHDDETLFKISKNGLQLLLNIVFKWICIPFRAPKFFFRVRPCFGSELFISSAETKNLDGISIMTGFHLSLNVCLQLKNMPPNLPFRLTKFYCILYCSPTLIPNGQNKAQTPWSSPPWERGNMVEMNEKLFRYVTECTRKFNQGKRRRDDDNDDGAVTTFVHFEPDSRGQGFSNCLLDVSKFPVGCYRIKWHSCCIDSQGCYWSLLPLNTEPVFTIRP